MKTTKTIQIKRGTSKTLSTTQKSHVLQEGEPFYHSGAEFVTIGDGNSPIDTLPKIGTGEKIEIVGANNKSSISIGTRNHVYVEDTIEVGRNTSVIGTNSIAIGVNSGTNAVSNSTITMGYNALAYGGTRNVNVNGNVQEVRADSQIVIGTNAVGQHRDVVAIGHGANAWNDTCIAIGGNAKTGACGYVSVAIGANANCASPFSIALGKDAHTWGNDENQIAIGTEVRSDGTNVIAIGRSASAGENSAESVAIGCIAQTFAQYAVAIGYNVSSGNTTEARHDIIAIGSNTTIASNGAIAIGSNTDVGNFNALSQIVNGGDSSVCIGDSSACKRDGSIAIGSGANVSDIAELDGLDNSIAIGTNSSSMTGSSIAIGVLSRAGGSSDTEKDGNSCISIGESSTSSGDNALAIGVQAKSGSNRSIALGTCSVATEVAAISIGGYSNAGRFAVDIGGSAKFVGDNYTTRDITGEESVSILGFAGNFGVSIGDVSSAGKLGVSIGYNAKSTYGGTLSRVAIGENAVASEDNKARLQFFNQKETGFENHAFIGSSAILLSGSSDRRLKQNIESANTEMCLSDVCSIPLYKYEYKPFVKETEDRHLVGWMADDVEKVFKHAVFESDRTFTECDEDGNDIINSETGEPKQFTIEKVKSINMQRVGLPTLWGAVQELSKLVTKAQEQIETLEKTATTLKKQNTSLEKRVKELEATKEETAE